MRKPFLGILSFFNSNGQLSPKFSAYVRLCFAEGIDVVCFSAEDVDMDKKTIHAKVWSFGSLSEEDVLLPEYVVCGKCDDSIRSFFCKNSKVLDNVVFTKISTNKALLDSRFADMVIPTMYTRTFDNTISFSNIWPEVIIKPVGGAKGEGVYSLKKLSKDSYILRDAYDREENMDYKQCKERLAGLYDDVAMIQPKLAFLNKDGNTMDFRINVSKGAKGKWRTVFIIPRTSRSSIVSNFSHGGYAGLLMPTLEIDYGENARKVYEILESIGRELPVFLEETAGCNLLSLGIDVGFDYESLTPYIIEVNQIPKITFPDKLKVVNAQVEYFKYLSQKYNENKKTS